MPDYYPLLTRAVSGLERNTREARLAVFDRARQALLKQLKGVSPPLAEAEITRERLVLEEAIKRIESEAAQKEAQASRTPPPPREPPRSPVTARPAVPPRPPVRTPTPSRDRAPGEGAKPSAYSAVKAAADENVESSAPVDLDHAPAGGAKPVKSAEPAAPAQGPRPFRPGAGRFMRDGERRALQAKLLVGGLVALLIVLAVGLGYIQRERIFAFFGGGTAPGVATDGKVADRVGAGPQATPAPGPAPGPGTVSPVGQRAVLYEENPTTGQQQQQVQTFVGTAVWRTETLSPGPGRPPEIGVRVDIDIPDRRLSAVMTIRRNPDANLPASHTIEIQFNTPNDPFGGVANMPGVRLKTSETAQGAPLAALVVRVTPGFFLVGLSAVDADREQNIQFLRERTWFDIPFVYNNGRRAVLAFEKGTPGERALNEALASWRQ
ncbi:MAG TPA: hypothetical protein VIG34_00940 [Xanthobacteraceae bacterium]|jgi:hypothetical protein